MAELGSVSAVVRTSRVRSLLDRCPLQVASGPSRRCDPGLDGGGRRFNSWVGSCAPLPETGDQHRPRLTEQRRRGEAAGDKYLSPGKKGRRGQEKREAAVVVTQPCSPSRTNFQSPCVCVSQASTTPAATLHLCSVPAVTLLYLPSPALQI